MVAPESLRVLASFARPHRRTLVVGLLLALAASALGLATPMVTKWVLDALNNGSSLGGPVAALLVLLVIGAVLYRVQWVLLGTLGERVVLDARESMVRRYFRATIPAVTARPPGELVSRAVSDTVLLREAASSSVIGLINGAVMLVGTLVLMGFLDLVLLGTTVAAVLVVIVLFAVLMPGIAKAQERAQEHVGRVGGTLEGTLRAIRTVKASGAEDRQAERIAADARASAEYGIRAVRLEATVWTIAWTGIQLAVILILGVGAWRVGEGQLEVSSLIAFLLYAFGLMEPITELSENLTALQSGIAAAERIRAVDELDAETDGPTVTDGPSGPVPDTSGPVPEEKRDPSGPVLELKGVTASYGPGREPVVRGVDLVVPARGHTAIVGPSGAGKTTVFSLLLRFLEPQEGALLLDGVPYHRHSHAAIRSRLAYVEQDTPVVPGTIRDNLLISRPEAGEEELRQVLADVRLTEKVESLDEGLDTELSTAAVSGGERQRIALARALLRKPDVLLLDEATAQLDALTESAVHHCVRRRAREHAVVTIAHRLSTVIDADTIVVMDAGGVRARGTHDELLATDSLYRDLVEALRIADGSPADAPAKAPAA
ncbi:ABC transporter ATP-binding protein [Streptomyces phaeochromogenes]|uniref:ABC transporter ATP-binding protein n=1 Tax=Streptomyces phaeochromogenes TaxID=1923 RepID=UPI002DDC2C89|nr:ABC transporter ATP-binding protein [Streptomyces phaeochromogenes]WRZ36199.1 ABC transporter ATP-binding protein/permease [Streptomyces phaeochromogenes]WSJ11746.1 ABC transporter ATP-binding protein/permease [Streptomyces phaeochromogenes]